MKKTACKWLKLGRSTASIMHDIQCNHIQHTCTVYSDNTYDFEKDRKKK